MFDNLKEGCLSSERGAWDLKEGERERTYREFTCRLSDKAHIIRIFVYTVRSDDCSLTTSLGNIDFREKAMISCCW